MRRLTAALAATLLALSVLSGHPLDRPMHPLEDQPGWNCQTDGNRTCDNHEQIRLVSSDSDYSYYCNSTDDC